MGYVSNKQTSLAFSSMQGCNPPMFRLKYVAPALTGLALLACSQGTPAPCAPTAQPAEEVATPTPPPAAPAPQLGLWRAGTTRQAIEEFVKKVTTEGSPDFVPVAERIAVFDNDGTLWSEQPMYVQLVFALQRVKELAPEHPEWKTKPAFQAVLKDDFKALAATGTAGLLEIVAATQGGNTADEFEKVATAWLKQAQHPKYQRPYTELTFAPMVELLAFLREHDFKIFIVSGGGVAFMRPITEAVYGIPPERVIGSRMKSEFKDGQIHRTTEVGFLDDGPGKPVGIYEHIGRRPILTAGNSDGDLAMLEWTLNSEGPHLALLVHHTDDERETAYDRDSHFGKLDKALDAANSEEAQQKGWLVVDVKNDWKKVFAFQEESETAPPAEGIPAP